MRLFCFFLTILCQYLAYSHNGAPFDYLMLTTIYPTAVCRADDDSVPESCEIPDKTPQWTIHGLWPNYDNGSYPQNCNGFPKHFDENLIKPIEDKLIKLWPNLYPKKSVTSFWKHEYEKHGTCAQSVTLFGTELDYFTEVMKVYNSIDIEGALKSIGPSETPITSKDVTNALSGITGGKQFQFHCLKDKKTKQYLLADVRFCLNKDLSFRDCSTHHSQNYHQNRVSRFDRSTREKKHGQAPLPTFQPCPAEFIYLASTNVSSSNTCKPCDTSASSFFGRVWSAIKSIGL